MDLVFLLVILLAVACALSREPRETFAEYRPDPTSLHWSGVPSNLSNADMLLGQAVQAAPLQTVAPKTSLTPKESTATVNTAIDIVRQRANMHLTVITVNSADKQRVGSDQVYTFNVSVFDKDRNATYVLTIEAIVDIVAGSMRISRCQRAGRAQSSMYQGVPVPGYGYEFGPPL